jgi:Pentapeptide repeats (9 copies)
VTFTEEVDFYEAAFKEVVDFTKAKFRGPARFKRTKFEGDVWFDGAQFTGSTLDLTATSFGHPASLIVETDSFCCARTQFLRGANLHARKAQVVVDRLWLTGRSLVHLRSWPGSPRILTLQASAPCGRRKSPTW